MPPVMAGRWAQIRSLWTRPAAQWPGAGRVPRLPVIACSSDPSGTGREVASRHAPRADTTGGYASLIPPAEADRGAPRSALSWSPNLAKPCPAGGRQPFKHGRSVLLRHSGPQRRLRPPATNAATVSAAAASRSLGSQQQAARSRSPNGPRVVTAMTAASPASIVSGIRSCAAGPPAMFHRQCSTAPEQSAETGQQPEGGRGAAAEQVPPRQPQRGGGGPVCQRGGAARCGEFWTRRRSWQLSQGELAGPERGQVGGEPGVPGGGRQRGEPPSRGIDRPAQFA